MAMTSCKELLLELSLRIGQVHNLPLLQEGSRQGPGCDATCSTSERLETLMCEWHEHNSQQAAQQCCMHGTAEVETWPVKKRLTEWPTHALL